MVGTCQRGHPKYGAERKWHCPTCHAMRQREARRRKKPSIITVQEYLAAGLCRAGKHTYPGTGRCRECGLEAQRRHNRKRYAENSKELNAEKRQRRALANAGW
jgi:hypothetical protein